MGGVVTRAAFFDFTIGEFTLAELNIRHLIERVTFTEEIGKFDSVTIEFQQGPELNDAYILLKHGAVFQLSGGYRNEISRPIMLGFNSGSGISCENRTATLNIFGYLGALDKGEKQRVLQNRTIRQVVEEIIADYPSLVVGTIENEDTIINETSSQSNQTDLKYLESIARQFGMKWKTEPTDTVGIWAISLESIVNGDDPNSHPTVVFNPYKTQQTRSNYRHLKSFDVESNIMGISSSINILSNNPNQPINVSSEDYDPTIYQTGEVRGSAIVYEVFGTVNKLTFYENVTNEEAAQAIAVALQQEDEISFVHAENGQLAEGDPEFRAGQYRNIILNDIPLYGDVFSGVYLITKTIHVWGKGESYVTRFEAGRSTLTPPPPPELESGWGGGGSGSGTPVIIRWLANGHLQGWYASFGPNNEVILGAPITETDIVANAYWMSKISVTGAFTGPIPMIGGITGNINPLGVPPIMQGDGILETGESLDNPQTCLPAGSYGELYAVNSPFSTEWYIDFPPSWTTNPLCSKLVGQSTTVVPATIDLGFLGEITYESAEDYYLEQQKASIEERIEENEAMRERAALAAGQARYDAFWGSEEPPSIEEYTNE